MRIRSPQEKKKLSYARDRRNVYGESPHASRRNIPLQKARRNRANRRLANQGLAGHALLLAEVAFDDVESRIYRKSLKGWKKYPDSPLGKVLAEKSRRRKVMREIGGRQALITRTIPNQEQN